MIRLSAIGDTCNAQAAALAIRDAWPETTLTWIIGKTEATLLADTPGIEFIIFDKSLGLRAYRELCRSLAGRRFDVLLMMHASMRANLVSLCATSSRRVGFDRHRARDYQWLFSRERIEPHAQPHVVDGFMQFVRYIGAGDAPPRWQIPVSEADRRAASELRGDAARLMIVSPCSSQRLRNFRNWSAANYTGMIDAVSADPGVRTILTGGRSALEREYAAAICDATKADVVDLVGETSLKRLYALVGEADVVVCPDSGPAHMANAAGTPVVGLYATSNPDRTGPWRYRNLVVNAYPEAVRASFGKSTTELRWGERVRDAAAMDLISPDAVISRVRQVLSDSSPTSRS